MSTSPPPKSFNIITAYQSHLENDASLALSAILALSDLLKQADLHTMFQLIQAVQQGADTLKQHFSNSIAISAGCDVFFKFVSSIRDSGSDFEDFKNQVSNAVLEYAHNVREMKETIARNITGFLKDDSTILTHACSRVVINTLLSAHKTGKRLSVYVTETRPKGYGLQTQEILAKEGVPCTIILDSAVAYVMDKVDMVLVGCEAVVESGGIINAIGSSQLAIVAKAYNKPVYVLAESYKFTRLFPLSQYDLPTHTPQLLSFPSLSYATPPHSGRNTPQPKSSEDLVISKAERATMTDEQIKCNPEVDYTAPQWISLLFTDAGILTPEGVSQYLVAMSLRSELS